VFAAAVIRNILRARLADVSLSISFCHDPIEIVSGSMAMVDSTKIQRSYKFRCYSNSLQRQQLAIEFFGHARWVRNICLA
jgi:putative transposase